MSETTTAHKVSVAIPTYNYGHFLPQALDSVLGQSYSDFELIISDNSSTDDTREIANRYARKDPRIRYYLNELNVGMTGNWNLCLERSTGKFIKILCADDLLEPTCLEMSVDAMDKHPDAALVCTARALVDSRLEPLATLSYSDRFESLDGRMVIKKCLLMGNLIGEPTAVLFRRDLALRGFLHTYKQLTDLEMWFHILEQGPLLSIPEPLCQLRQHAAQETKTNVRSLTYIDDEFLIFDTYVRKPYIRCSFLEKQKFRYDRVLQLWAIRREGVDPAIITKKMSQYYNPYLFQFLHFIHMIKHAHDSRK